MARLSSDATIPVLMPDGKRGDAPHTGANSFLASANESQLWFGQEVSQ
jgi:hypothetical protein